MSVKKQYSPQGRIFVCTYEKEGRCRIGEGEKCVSWLKDEIKDRGLKRKVAVTKTKCQGYCDKKGTSVTFASNRVFQQYSAMRLNDLISQTEEFLDNLQSNGLKSDDRAQKPISNGDHLMTREKRSRNTPKSETEV